MTRLLSEVRRAFGEEVAPRFQIAVQDNIFLLDTSLGPDIQPLVHSVTFEDDEILSSQIEIEFINHPTILQGLATDWQSLLSYKPFQEGNFIDLWFGYGQVIKYMDRGEIVKWMPKFGEAGPQTFTIVAHDGRHRMQTSNKIKKRKRKTVYRNLPDHLIVKKIASKYGFGVDVDESKLLQKNIEARFGDDINRTGDFVRVQAIDESDWAFIEKLAKMNFFDLWVDYSRAFQKYIVHFKRRVENPIPVFNFVYGVDAGGLLSAEPDFALKDIPNDVEISYYDKSLRQVVVDNVSVQELGENMKSKSFRDLKARKSVARGAVVRFTAFGQTVEAISDRPFKSKRDAKAFIRQYLAEREEEFLLLTGKILGEETIRSGQYHNISGLGPRIDGLYKFTNVKHIMKPGDTYVCEFTAFKVLPRTVTKNRVTYKLTGCPIDKLNRGNQNHKSTDVFAGKAPCPKKAKKSNSITNSAKNIIKYIKKALK